MAKLYCVLMCGGRGTRIKPFIESDMEKPLIKLKDKPLVEYLLDALIQTNKFEKIFAAASNNTCRTQEYLKNKFQNKITLLETSGKGYSNDYIEMIKYFKSLWNEKKSLGNRILFLPADIPMISSILLMQILNTCQKKPCLAIVLEKDYIQSHGFIPTEYEFTINKKKYCYSGISMIDVSKINMDITDENKVQLLDEEYLVLNKFEIACNINTSNDLQIVKNYCKEFQSN
jgi:adenosylcobinamide-phosphate guanylyltransferase